MEERDFEEILTFALREYAKVNDLPLEVATVKEKGFGEDVGLIVSLGANEFHVNITQTVFEGE
jgi:hypothetical protein